MLTKNGVSPGVSATWIWITLILFIVIYGVFAVVDAVLMVRYGRKCLAEGEGEEGGEPGPDGTAPGADDALVLTY